MTRVNTLPPSDLDRLAYVDATVLEAPQVLARVWHRLHADPTLPLATALMTDTGAPLTRAYVVELLPARVYSATATQEDRLLAVRDAEQAALARAARVRHDIAVHPDPRD